MIAWIASFTIPEWALVAAAVLTFAVVGMTVTLYMITGRSRRRDDDGLDDYMPGSVVDRYRAHEGWF